MCEHWDNSPALREAVERELDNWGAWSRIGAGSGMGFPDASPFTDPPNYGSQEAVDDKLAEKTERILSLWAQSGEIGQQGVFLLKLSHVEHRALEDITYHFARRFKKNPTTEAVGAFLDESRMIYWALLREFS